MPEDAFFDVESGCMDDISHGSIWTNGIAMHVAEQGEGPAVVLCHGFPELWYSWRHQFKALADAGFHAIAPDQRGTVAPTVRRPSRSTTSSTSQTTFSAYLTPSARTGRSSSAMTGVLRSSGTWHFGPPSEYEP